MQLLEFCDLPANVEFYHVAPGKHNEIWSEILLTKLAPYREFGTGALL